MVTTAATEPAGADGRGSLLAQEEFDRLRDHVTAWVEGPGEDWSARIEATGEAPPELFAELRDEGFLGLAAPVSLGGRGLSFTQWMYLMEIFSRSHASIRMLVHVINGTWRSMNPHATPAQRERFVRASVAGDILVAFTLTEPDNGTGSDISSHVRRQLAPPPRSHPLRPGRAPPPPPPAASTSSPAGCGATTGWCSLAWRAPARARARWRCWWTGTPAGWRCRTPLTPWGCAAPTTPP